MLDHQRGVAADETWLVVTRRPRDAPLAHLQLGSTVMTSVQHVE